MEMSCLVNNLISVINKKDNFELSEFENLSKDDFEVLENIKVEKRSVEAILGFLEDDHGEGTVKKKKRKKKKKKKKKAPADPPPLAAAPPPAGRPLRFSSSLLQLLRLAPPADDDEDPEFDAIISDFEHILSLR